jgi:hypothetical protein
MLRYLKKSRAFSRSTDSDSAPSFIDAMIVGSFVIGAIGLGAIWLLI